MGQESEVTEVCICGYSKQSHEDWPEECGVCPCVYRPSLPWPDSVGAWWIETPLTLYSRCPCYVCFDEKNGVYIAYICNYYFAREYFEEKHGPARFVKLIEQNPFEATPNPGEPDGQ